MYRKPKKRARAVPGKPRLTGAMSTPESMRLIADVLDAHPEKQVIMGINAAAAWVMTWADKATPDQLARVARRWAEFGEAASAKAGDPAGKTVFALLVGDPGDVSFEDAYGQLLRAESVDAIDYEYVHPPKDAD